jgi:hypothetical protein
MGGRRAPRPRKDVSKEGAGAPAIARTPAPKRQTTGLSYIAIPRRADPLQLHSGLHTPAGLDLRLTPARLVLYDACRTASLSRLNTLRSRPSSISGGVCCWRS